MGVMKLKVGLAIVGSIMMAQAVHARVGYISVPEVVRATGASAVFMRSRIQADLLKQWQPQCQCELEISELALPPRMSEASVLSWKLLPVSEVPRGSFNLNVQLIYKGMKEESTWIKGRTKWLKLVPVARQTLNMGQRVLETDVSFEVKDVTFQSESSPDKGELIGRRLRMGVASGSVIRLSSLERPKALRRGDMVKVMLSGEDWEVTMTGLAEQDGELGDLIRVKNPKTQQILMATVVGRREVRAEQ